jgi:DoxX-like protein
MTHLGYPAYFMTILGFWKVLVGAAILLPGFPLLKEWAYAGMIFDLTGASASRVASGDAVFHILTRWCWPCWSSRHGRFAPRAAS